jgi:hypothetical protein
MPADEAPPPEAGSTNGRDRRGGGGGRDASGDGEVVAETLAALEMPRRGLHRWFRHDQRFCHAHGGHRVYGELLDLLDRYEEALAASGGPAGGETRR